jgi:hypothetical protein
MKKILLKDFIFQGRVKDHDLIRDKLLSEIEKTNHTVIERSPGSIDSISKLDWNWATDTDRSWTSLFEKYFCDAIDDFLSVTPYLSIELKEMWFQQYVKCDMHNWHTHGEQYTGVYYLEFPKGSSKTELVFPYDHSKHQIPVEEGDIIFFPAHVAHRGTTNFTDRKTIISFNFSIGNDYEDILDFKVLNSAQ